MSLLLVLGLLGLLLCLASAGQTAVLYTYDLTHTLHFDRNNPAQVRASWDEVHLVSSLQGLVNRDQPRLYVFYVGGDTGAIDHFWLDKLREKDGWLSDYQLQSLPDLEALLSTFAGYYKGLVVYDEKVPATSNVASTVAGVENLLCVRYDASSDSLYHWLTAAPDGPRLQVKRWLIHPDGTSLFTGEGTLPESTTPSSGSAKDDAYLWAKERYLDTGLCNGRKLAYYLDAYWLEHPEGYPPNCNLANHDYFIAHKGFFFDLSPWDDETPNDDPDQPLGSDFRTLKAILRSAYEQTHGKAMIHVGGFLPWDKKYTDYGTIGGKHGGVPGEWRYAEILSCYNAYMDADALGLNAMANASVFQHYPLQPVYPQHLPTLSDLQARGLVDEEGKVAPKVFYTVYVGDYDSAAWLYQKLPQLWSDPARGTIPLGWAINPNLAERFAPGMDYMRRTATPQDFFWSGDSGAGYLNPGFLETPRPFSNLPSGLETWRKHCKRYFRRWGLEATGFIIDGYARPMSAEGLEAYKSFSPRGLVGQHVEGAELREGFPQVKMYWDLPSPEEGARIIQAQAGGVRPAFRVYRTILWTPSQLKRLYELAAAGERGKDICVVDPYTLLLLVKQFFTTGQRARRAGNDLWDLSAGIEILGHSPLNPGSDARDLFGSEFSPVEPGVLLFGDAAEPDTVHWIEWRTRTPVELESYSLYAKADDTPAQDLRVFAAFKLFSRMSPDEQWQLVDSYECAQPYKFQDRLLGLLVQRKLPEPVEGRYFRAEFLQARPGWGPRVLELEGFGKALPAED